MTFEEAEDWKLYDLHYKGTKQQANAIWLELIATDAWRAYEMVDNQLRFGRWRMTDADSNTVDRFEELCRLRMEHLTTVYAIVADLIERHTQ